MPNYTHNNLTIVLFLAATFAASSNLVLAESSTPSGKATGRFVALQPPPAGDNTYGNFLWVLDTVTGNVVAYRISKVNDAQGNLDSWITERLLTEEQYTRLLRLEKK